MKKLTAFIFVTLILTQLASADLIAPGFKVIPTTNKITNMDDFPDHVFIFTAKLGESVCALEKIENDGVLPSVYKFCQPSVYAIEKSNFNEEEFQNLLNLVSENRECPQLESYLTNSNAKLIVTDIRVYNQVPVSSSQESVTYLYTIDLSKTLSKPTNTQSERNFLVYFYVIIPIAAIAIILLIIFKRKKNA